MTTAIASSANRPRLAPVWPMLWAQTRAEFLKLWRIPAFSLSSMAFPLLFYAFFGLPNAHQTISGVSVGTYLLGSFAAYSCVSIMLFSFGLGVSGERAQRMHVLMRATPLRPSVYLAARVITAVAFALLTLLVLFLFAALAGGVQMPLAQWGILTASLLLGSLPFVALGFGIGYSVGPNSAPAVVNLVFLPLSFASGLFVPIASMPSIIQHIAPYLPTYHYGQLAWTAVGASDGSSIVPSVIWLAGYGVAFAALAIRSYWREQGKEFG